MSDTLALGRFDRCKCKGRPATRGQYPCPLAATDDDGLCNWCREKNCEAAR